MNLFNKRLSFLSIYSLLLCLFVNYHHVNSMQSNVNSQARIGQIHEALAQNRYQIEKLTKKLQFRSKINPLSKNNSTNKKFTRPYQELYTKLPVFTLQHLKQSSGSIQFGKQCKVKINKEQTFSIPKIDYNFISSSGQYLIFINHHQTNSLLIYNFNCTQLAQISNLTVKFFFSQQNIVTKGGYQSKKDQNNQPQSIFAISDKNDLIEIDIQSVKKSNLQKKQLINENVLMSSKFKFYRILNNKIIAPGSNKQIIGVVGKTIISPKSRTKQQHSTNTQKLLLIALDSSQINIYDESGTLKLTMKQPSVIDDMYEELNGKEQRRRKVSEKSLQLVNHHPHPLLLEDNWVYMIDTNKYTRQPWPCPYIPHIRKLFVQNIHSSIIYVLTSTHILKLNIKPKDTHNTKIKQCQLQIQIPYFDPDTNYNNNYNYKKPLDEISFTVYNDIVFVNGLTYNLTAKRYEVIERIMEEKVEGQEEGVKCEQCSLNYIPFALISQMKKSQSDKTYTLALLCRHHQSEYLYLYPITETTPQSSVLIYVIFAFLFVIFFAVKFFKSSGTSYQRQLLYSMDLRAEQKQARREHYDQVWKYMDQASKIQKLDTEKESNIKQKSWNKSNEESKVKKS